jgi:hypothetical protein
VMQTISLLTNVRETLEVSKHTTHVFNMVEFNRNKLKETELKESIGLKLQIGSQLWKTSTVMCI